MLHFLIDIKSGIRERNSDEKNRSEEKEGY